MFLYYIQLVTWHFIGFVRYPYLLQVFMRISADSQLYSGILLKFCLSQNVVAV